MIGQKWLIINADDFGLHSAINQGIQAAHLKGCLTSATLITPGSAFEEAVQMTQTMPDLSVGLHLTLVGNLPPISPASQVSSLLTNQGLFRDNHISFIKDWFAGKIKKDHIYQEWSAQIEKTLNAGIEISHLDSHQHLHVLPAFTDLILKLADTYSILAVRIPNEPFTFFATGPLSPSRIIARNGLTLCANQAASKWKKKLSAPDHFFGMLAGGQMTLDRWKKLIPHLPEGISEVMTHPGKANAELSASFSWSYHWQEELEALQSEELQKWLQKYSIRLTNYRNLKDPSPIKNISS